MLNLADFNSLQPFLAHNLSSFQIYKNPQQVSQIHAISVKKATFDNPLISSRLLALYADPKINNLDNARSVLDRKGCARLGAIEEAKQIHGLALKIGFALDMFVQSSLVSVYSKCSDIDSASDVFDRMELFEQMPERDAFSWTVLVDGLSKHGKVEDARKLFDRMPRRNWASRNAMISGYMKSGDFYSARHLFDQMEERNIITWNTMISGYEFNGRFSEALEMFNTMLNMGLKPNNATLVSTLSAISGLALLTNGKWIHSYIAKNGFKLEGVLGTLLVEMYCKNGSIESALRVFQGIPNKKLGHWTAIIVGLGVHGMARDALKLFLKMRRVGLVRTAITFIGVLNACNHAGLVNEGRRYFNMMINEYGIEPTVEHYGCLVDILCRAGHLEEAKNVIETMPMKPNKVIWMSLLSGSRSHRNIEIGEYAAERVLEVAPDAIGCYVLLSNMYAVAGKWDKVSKVREIMRTRGFKEDPGCSSIEHKGVLHEFIVGDKSHSQIKEINSKLSEMRERLKSVGHVADTSQVLLYIEDEKEKEAELENHSERLAIAFGLINVKPGNPIRIMKNLRLCNDCHTVTKLLSKIYEREIIVRDNSRFHHFENGSCSCGDYW